jgi:hypothetical protein
MPQNVVFNHNTDSVMTELRGEMMCFIRLPICELILHTTDNIIVKNYQLDPQTITFDQEQ